MPSYFITQKAQENIDEILVSVVDYTGFEESALRLEDELHRKFSLIADFPHIGTDRKDGTFETFVKSYRIIYELVDDSIFITTVNHIYISNRRNTISDEDDLKIINDYIKIRIENRILNWEENNVFSTIFKLLNEDKYSEFTVLAQVPLGIVFSTGYGKAYKVLNKRRFDFVIINESNRPVVAIEYHGTGHYQGDYEYKDEIKRTVCRKARLELIEIRHDEIEQKLDVLREFLDNYLSLSF